MLLVIAFRRSCTDLFDDLMTMSSLGYVVLLGLATLINMIVYTIVHT